MKTLHINEGMTISTAEGFLKITGKHFGDYAVDRYEIDENGNETKTGSAILKASEIKKAMHDATGDAFDLVVYDGDDYRNQAKKIIDAGNYDAAVALMDDEIRESVHADLAPCTDLEFLTEYMIRHEAEYGETFAV